MNESKNQKEFAMATYLAVKCVSFVYLPPSSQQPPAPFPTPFLTPFFLYFTSLFLAIPLNHPSELPLNYLYSPLRLGIIS